MFINKVLLIFLSLCIIGCSKESSPIEQDSEGKFVVESYSVVCSVKNHPINDSVWSYVSYDLKYQFKVLPGTIQNITLRPVNYTGMGLYLENAYPDSIGKIYEWSYGFWIKDSLAGIDSITIITKISGFFWNPENIEPRFLGDYKWEDNRRIRVNH